eukprot:3905470-Pyramimonas_sp.AAC.1
MCIRDSPETAPKRPQKYCQEAPERPTRRPQGVGGAAQAQESHHLCRTGSTKMVRTSSGYNLDPSDCSR